MKNLPETRTIGTIVDVTHGDIRPKGIYTLGKDGKWRLTGYMSDRPFASIDRVFRDMAKAYRNL